MGSYASVQNVADEFKNISFSSTTHPTDTAVDRFITESESYVNARLKVKYQLPITDPDAVNLLRLITLGFVVARVREIQRVQTGNPGTSQDVRGGADPVKMANDLLDQIITDKITLPNSTPYRSSDGVVSYNFDTPVSPFFRKDTQQW